MNFNLTLKSNSELCATENKFILTNYESFKNLFNKINQTNKQTKNKTENSKEEHTIYSGSETKLLHPLSKSQFGI